MRAGGLVRGSVLAVLLVAAAVLLLDRAFPPDLSRYQARSLALLDRDGAPLDVTTSPDGFLRLGATVDEVDPAYLRLLLATEDARFERHPGVDPLALLRAAWQLATRRRVVSGGSTLSMQVARLLEPHRHDVVGKLHDIARALQLEARFPKSRILSMYLTLAPFGGSIEGVRTASLVWFGHEPSRLTQGEAALLVALPRSPGRLRPDRHPDRAVQAARAVLVRADPTAPVPDLPQPVRHSLPVEAPHLAARLRGRGLCDEVRTTLDGALQRDVVALAARERPWMEGHPDLAALVVRNADRTVAAYLGGADYFGPQGMVDMVRAQRSPGSALKPFIYGLAFDDGLVRPDTLIEDDRTRIGDYAPRDFDRLFHGTVTVREALQQSFNLPAVALLDRVGPGRFVSGLRQAGAVLVLPRLADRAALPVALGGVGISMQDLAMLYAGLAQEGRATGLRVLADERPGSAVPVMTAASARQVGDILRGTPTPDGVAAEGRRGLAYKTGTSYGFRDAWAAGFSGDYTVVVWTGRKDGTPVPGSYGRASAAPLLFRVFDLLPRELAIPLKVDAPPAPTAPDLFRFSGSRRGTGGNPQIVFPPQAATLEIGSGPQPASPIALEAAGGSPPYRWLVNGVPLPRQPVGLTSSWMPDGPGFAHIAVADARNRTASVDVRLK